MKPITLATTLLLLFWGCNKPTGNSYAIKDFSKTLQPYLVKIVSKGVVAYSDATHYIKTYATDEELLHLSHAENPVLRSIAFKIMLEKPSFNHYEILMHNLDDTAIVAVDWGEWGLNYLTVSDNMLEDGSWKDTASRKRTVEEIVLKHNFLRSAYLKAGRLPVDEKYYLSIKAMAFFKIDEDVPLRWLRFADIEDALYTLARYKKREDTYRIKYVLEDNVWRLGETSFALISQYPDTSYLSILEEYFKHHFYSRMCRDRNLSGNAISFINAVAAFKNERSAKILKSIFSKPSPMPCNVNLSELKTELLHAVYRNKCDFYGELNTNADQQEQREQGGVLYITPDTLIVRRDTFPEPIRW